MNPFPYLRLLLILCATTAALGQTLDYDFEVGINYFSPNSYLGRDGYYGSNCKIVAGGCQDANNATTRFATRCGDESFADIYLANLLFRKTHNTNADSESSTNRNHPGTVTAEYKEKINVGQCFYHKGIDFSATAGTPVYAPVSGKVHLTRNCDGLLTVYNEEHDFYFIFYHLNSFKMSKGDTVKVGDQVGTSGTKLCNGSVAPHLHVELRTDTPYARPASCKEGGTCYNKYQHNYDPRLVLAYLPSTMKATGSLIAPDLSGYGYDTDIAVLHAGDGNKPVTGTFQVRFQFNHATYLDLEAQSGLNPLVLVRVGPWHDRGRDRVYLDRLPFSVPLTGVEDELQLVSVTSYNPNHAPNAKRNLILYADATKTPAHQTPLIFTPGFDTTAGLLLDSGNYWTGSGSILGWNSAGPSPAGFDFDEIMIRPQSKGIPGKGGAAMIQWLKVSRDQDLYLSLRPGEISLNTKVTLRKWDAPETDTIEIEEFRLSQDPNNLNALPRIAALNQGFYTITIEPTNILEATEMVTIYASLDASLRKAESETRKGPVLTANTDRVYFGKAAIGERVSQRITIKNNGIVPAQNIRFNAGNRAFTAGIPSSLAAGASASITLYFRAETPGTTDVWLSIAADGFPGIKLPARGIGDTETGDTTVETNRKPQLTVSHPSPRARLLHGERVGLRFAADDADGIARIDITLYPENGGTGISVANQLPAGTTHWDYTPPSAYGKMILLFKATDTTGKITNVSVPVDIVAPSNDEVRPQGTPVVKTNRAVSLNGAYQISWSQVTGATFYMLYERRGTSITSKKITGTAYNYTGKQQGEWRYQVAAGNSKGLTRRGGPVLVKVVDGNPLPSEPVVRKPEHKTEDVPLDSLRLSWHSREPDEDDLPPKFKVVLGTDQNAMTVVRDYTADRPFDPWYVHPQRWEADTTYFWQVTARDEYGREVEGPLWSFTTVPALEFPAHVFEDATASWFFEDQEYIDQLSFSVATADITGNGEQDVLFLSRADGDVPVILFLNDGTQLTRTDAAGFAGITSGTATGAAFQDYDHDGRLDVLICFKEQAPRLFRQTGAAVFSDVTATAGLDFTGADIARNYNNGSWADYDGDGDVDLYTAWGHRLFQNQGNGRFVDATEASRIDSFVIDHAHASFWTDANNDNRPDLVTTGPFGTLYTNRGDGTFGSTKFPLLIDSDPNTPAFFSPSNAQAAAQADFNNDGLPDYYFASWRLTNDTEPDVLLLNRGDYYEVVNLDDIGIGRRFSGHALAVFDYDNDGRTDLLAEETLFRNMGVDEMDRPLFLDITGNVGLPFDEPIYGIAVVDLDHNGSMDLITATRHENQVILGGVQTNHWLSIQSETPMPPGTRIRVTADDRETWLFPNADMGSGDQSSSRVHTGLGTADTADILILWPDGARDETYGVAANTVFTIEKGQYRDTLPPAAITDPMVIDWTGDQVQLQWTAPGDDGLLRPVAAYHVRYATLPIATVGWENAQIFEPALTPAGPGELQTARVTGLQPDTTYYFAVTALDEVGNQGTPSGEVSATTSFGTQILDFRVTLATIDRIDLGWRAPDTPIQRFEVKRHAAPINSGNIGQATTIQVPEQIYEPGEAVAVSIQNLTAGQSFYVTVVSIDADGNTLPLPTSIEVRTRLPFANEAVYHSSFSTDIRSYDPGPFFSDDMNGDGQLDLVIAGERKINDVNTTVVGIYHGSSLGFADEADVLIYPTNSTAGYRRRTAVGDLDGDGVGDVMIGEPQDLGLGSKRGAIRIHRGGNPMTQNAGALLGDAGVADTRLGQALLGGYHFIGSATPDLVAYAPGLQQIRIYPGGDGAFPNGSSYVSLDATGLPSTIYMAAGDVNGDQKMDLVVRDESRTLSCYLSTPTGLSSTRTSVTLPDSVFNPSLPVVGNFDGDAYDDIAVLLRGATSSENNVAVYRGFSGVNWQNATPLIITGVAAGQTAMSTADLNNDGLDDLIVANEDDLTFSEWRGVVRVFLGHEGFDIGPDLSFANDTLSDFGRWVHGLGDVDGDGFGDMLVTGYDHQDGFKRVHALYKGGPMEVQNDIVPPGQVTNLAGISPRVGTVALSWTAPGDDGAGSGRAVLYELEATTNPDHSFRSFGQGQNVPIPSPGTPGDSEHLVIDNLLPNVTYRFALRAFDELGNVSEISNIAEVRVATGYGFEEKMRITEVTETPNDGQSLYINLLEAVNGGNIDGQGGDDLVISGGHPYGRARVFLGGSDSDNQPDWDHHGYSGDPDDMFREVHAIGNVNGQGGADLFVPYHENQNGYVSYSGSGTVPSASMDRVYDRDIVRLGKVNGDQYEDFISGTAFFAGGSQFPANPTLQITPGGSIWDTAGLGLLQGGDQMSFGAGIGTRVAIYDGGPGFDAAPDRWIDPPDAFADGFGRSVEGLGDIDGDGVPDFAIGASNGGEKEWGRVYIYSGMNTSPTYTLDAPPGAENFSGNINTVGDLNGDGYDDFLVYAQDMATGSGHLVYLGSPQGPQAVTVIYWDDAQQHDRFEQGSSSVNGGLGIDFDNDGTWELIWEGGRDHTYGVVYLMQLMQPDSDGDGIIDLEDPVVGAQPPHAPVLTTPLTDQQDVSLTGALTWTMNDATGLVFDLYLGTGDDPPLYLAGLTQQSISLTQIPLSPGTLYHWQVVARDAQDQETSSVVSAFVTEFLPIPGAPTLDPPDTRSSTSAQTFITLSWTADIQDQVEEFVVERSEDGTTFQTLVVLNEARTTYYDYDILPHTTYHYRVFAINATGRGPASEIEVITSFNTVPEPALPAVWRCQAGLYNELTPDASDRDGDATSWALLSGPTGLQYRNGTLTWTPTAGQMGEAVARLRLTDGYGGQVDLDLPLEVSDGLPPTVSVQLPTDLGSWQTDDSVVTLSGIATDNTGLTQVTWEIPGLTSGTTTGSGTWSVTDIPVSEEPFVVYIRAQDAYGNTGHDALSISRLCRAPAIEEQPPAQTVCEGDPVILRVRASGQDLTYRWWRDGVLLTEERGDTITIPAASMEDAGEYRCKVLSPCGARSTELVPVVIDNTRIVGQSPSLRVCPGAEARLYVAVSGESQSYQWQRNGFDLDGEVSASLYISNLKPDDYGVYTCRINTNCGDLISQAITVQQDEEMQIRVHPQPAIAQGLGSVYLVAEANCEAPPINWEWIDSATGQVMSHDPLLIRRFSETMEIIVRASDATGQQVSLGVRVLVSDQTQYQDMNGDGCNTLQDLHLLSEAWRSFDFQDPDGDGQITILDLFYINLDDEGVCQP